MGHRGRKSAAEAEAPVVIEGIFKKKVEPPDELTQEQKEIWRTTVSTEDPEFFATVATRDALKDYCRHRAEADRLSKVIDSFKTEWLRNSEGIKRYAELARQRGDETHRSIRIATKLRMTNQSRYSDKASYSAGRRAAKEPMPWEFDGEEES